MLTRCNYFFLHSNGDITITTGHSGVFCNNLRKRSKYTYFVNYDTYRKLAGAAVNMFRKKKNEVIFITYTTKEVIKHEKINQIFSNHIKNLKENYGLSSYLWVAERQKRGAIHYHCLFDIPFVDVRDINRSFGNSLANAGFLPSVNSVQIAKGWGAIVKNPDYAIRYFCKYATKVRGKPYNAKIYNYSHNITPKTIEITFEEYESLVGKYGKKRYDFQYSSVITGNNPVAEWDFIEKNRKFSEKNRVFSEKPVFPEKIIKNQNTDKQLLIPINFIIDKNFL